MQKWENVDISQVYNIIVFLNRLNNAPRWTTL